jgi:hypothetical protein
MKQDTFVVVEFQNYEEIQVLTTTCLLEAYKFISKYSKLDFLSREPCVYRQLENGELTMELY